MRDKRSASKPTKSDCAFFGAALLVFFIVIIISWPFLGARVLSWIVANDKLATWVQAVGSIGAIIGSAYLVRYQFVKMEMTKRSAAGDLLVESFLFFKMFNDGLDSLEININRGQVSVQEIIRLKSFLDEVLIVLRSIKLEELSSEWAFACVLTRSHAAILQSIFSDVESMLLKHFEKIPFFSLRAILNSSDSNFDEECILVYREIVFMHLYSKKLSESIAKLGEMVINHKEAQLRLERSKDLYEHFSKVYKAEA